MSYGIQRVSIEQLRAKAALLGVISPAATPKVEHAKNNIRVKVAAGRQRQKDLDLYWGSAWLSSHRTQTDNWTRRPGQTLCECAEAEAIRLAAPSLGNFYLHDEPVETLDDLDPELIRLVAALN